ncbi:MAG: hypothetical protein D6694_05835, partial [Gammaproteobacteria bacterium]
ILFIPTYTREIRQYVKQLAQANDTLLDIIHTPTSIHRIVQSTQANDSTGALAPSPGASEA